MMSGRNVSSALVLNPFEHPRVWRQKIIDNVKLTPRIRFNGKGFICALINSRCPVGCEHCMFFSNMSEDKNSVNTMTVHRLTSLMKLVRDSNTGYLLVSGGGECFLEPDLMCRIIEDTNADVTWMVTGAHWVRDKEQTREVVRKMYDAFLRGKHKDYGRKICIRVSLDSDHVERIARPNQNPLQYVVDLVRIFEIEYAHEDSFVLMIHSLVGEEALVNDLCKAISGEKLARHDPLHDKVKVTESALTVKLESGYEFEVTFAKLLLSDLAADLRDKETLKERIEVFEKDAFRNERGKPAIKYNADGRIGPNMLVVYNGRVAGGWQSEMPDVLINLDFDDFQSIMQKTLSDPGVLGTIENGLAYRFDIIQEVCPKAVFRSKAVNVRDYTSPVLLEEDKIKLYYSIRVLQDFVAQFRIKENELEGWPDEVRLLVSVTKYELQALYHNARYDIIQQFIESSHCFDEFVRCVKQYARERDPQTILEFFESNPGISKRTVDKWRLLLKRIVNGWYDLFTFNEEELGAIEEIESILGERILAGKRIYEGLSFL
ncbi:MAG: 4Fe-4S cluster-binding domain-containing protein [Methanosarcinales archaeon]|nr:4Fe-4S cluster-binding domain-containing protein [Methanosarcinales archaeon]